MENYQLNRLIDRYGDDEGLRRYRDGEFIAHPNTCDAAYAIKEIEQITGKSVSEITLQPDDGGLYPVRIAFGYSPLPNVGT
jgi:hypothetical protein